MMNKLLHPAFWGIALIYTFFADYLPYPVTIGVKAAPVLLLFIWSVTTLSGWLRAGMAFALLASAGGDILLAMKADMFVPGLASFLIAQLTYAVIFWSRRTSETTSPMAGIGICPCHVVVLASHHFTIQRRPADSGDVLIW